MSGKLITVVALLCWPSAVAEAEYGTKAGDETSFLQTGQVVASGTQRSEAEANRTKESVALEQQQLATQSRWPRTWAELSRFPAERNIVPGQGRYAAWKELNGMPVSPAEARMTRMARFRKAAMEKRRWRQWQIMSRRRFGEVKWLNPWHEGPHPWGWTTKLDQAVAGARIVNGIQKKRAIVEMGAARRALGLDAEANIAADRVERNTALTTEGWKNGLVAGAEGENRRLLERAALTGEDGLAAGLGGDGLVNEGADDLVAAGWHPGAAAAALAAHHGQFASDAAIEHAAELKGLAAGAAGTRASILGTAEFEGNGLAAGLAGVHNEAALDAGLTEGEVMDGLGAGAGGLGYDGAVQADGLGALSDAGVELDGLGDGATLVEGEFGVGLDPMSVDLSSRGSEAMDYRVIANQRARDAETLERTYYQAKLDADEAALKAVEADNYGDAKLQDDESATAEERREKLAAEKDADIKYYKARIAADEKALQEAMQASLVNAQLM